MEGPARAVVPVASARGVARGPWPVARGLSCGAGRGAACPVVGPWAWAVQGAIALRGRIFYNYIPRLGPRAVVSPLLTGPTGTISRAAMRFARV